MNASREHALMVETNCVKAGAFPDLTGVGGVQPWLNPSPHPPLRAVSVAQMNTKPTNKIPYITTSLLGTEGLLKHIVYHVMV